MSTKGRHLFKNMNNKVISTEDITKMAPQGKVIKRFGDLD
jgi:hypothetical protein